MKLNHQPVLLKEAVEYLVQDRNGIYIDATFGRGGHSKAILNELETNARLIALDKDLEAVAWAKQSFASEARFKIWHCSYALLRQVAEAEGVLNQVSGIVFDLGVSSPQLDTPERGFSWMREGPLDMRMNQTSGITAEEYLAVVSEEELAHTFYEYGEERYSRPIARAIVQERAQNPFKTTIQLAKFIEKIIPRREPGQHPATRCFQALRIKLNQELEELMSALAQTLELLKHNGRLVVISFHSLEDRLVKRFMRDAQRGFSLADYPWAQSIDHQPILRIVAKNIRPSSQEIQHNIRARSAIMRIAEKI